MHAGATFAILRDSAHDTPVVDPGLSARPGGSGPRYTCYPTADRFVEAFDASAYRHWLGKRRVGGFSRPLGLYVHVPLRDTPRYVECIEREMQLVAAALEGPRRLSRMHWGGGALLGDALAERLVGAIRSSFELEAGCEYPIDADPLCSHLLTHGDVVGLGVAAIGKVGPTYCQNTEALEDYYATIDAGRLATRRGVQLTSDDLARRAAIQALACHFSLAKESIETACLLDFDRYFAAEMAGLRALEADGLVALEPGWIHVTPRGRLRVRAVCAVFDRYARATQR